MENNYKENLILEIQNYLINVRSMHPSLPCLYPTGTYSQETRDAVAAFQLLIGLPATGSVDIQTFSKLLNENNGYLRKTRTWDRGPVSSNSFEDIEIGHQGDIVYAIKIILNSFSKKFTNYSKLQVTDIYDKETAEAVKVFQKRSMLPVTGIVDLDTWNLLVTIYDYCRFYK